MTVTPKILRAISCCAQKCNRSSLDPRQDLLSLLRVGIASLAKVPGARGGNTIEILGHLNSGDQNV
jgi:hypothetical protein